MGGRKRKEGGGGKPDALAREAAALGRNAEFMAYLAEVSASNQKRYTLEETEKEFGLERPAPRRARRG